MYTVPFLVAKLMDIGLVTVYYFIAGITLSWLVDHWMGPFDEEKTERRSIVSIVSEILLQFFLLGLLAYVMRNIVERIPFPLEGLGGFQHERLKEAHEGAVFVIVYLFFQEHLALNLKHLGLRLSGKVHMTKEKLEKKANERGLGQFI